MTSLLTLAGRSAGAIGIVVCAIAGLLRLSGNYWMAGFQVSTLMIAGIAALSTGCFLLLSELVSRR